MGHEPVGLDGSPALATMARKHSGCEVWEQNFLTLKLPARHFDGIFANASLFHVPRQELPRVLSELRASLRPDGVLFTSNPRGNNEEGWNRGRFGVYHDLQSWRAYLETAAFQELEHYYRPRAAACATTLACQRMAEAIRWTPTFRSSGPSKLKVNLPVELGT